MRKRGGGQEEWRWKRRVGWEGLSENEKEKRRGVDNEVVYNMCVKVVAKVEFGN